MTPIVIGLEEYFATHRETQPEFTAYRNHVEDLDRLIGLTFGDLDHRHEAIVASVRALPAVVRRSPRSLSDAELTDVRLCLERAWSMLRATWLPLERGEFTTEFNAIIPVTAYYATYHAVLGTIAATSQRGRHDHRTTLRDSAELVKHCLLPWPWSAMCTGCPQLDDTQFLGFPRDVSPVHALRSLLDDELPDRLGALLRTTRAKELDHRFADERKKIQKESRKNLRQDEKRQIATKWSPTTIFNVLWRIRLKASYEGADVFVLGASGSDEALRFGGSLVHVMDSTMMALETIADHTVGGNLVAMWLKDYITRSRDAETLERHRMALSPS